jgi:hypothetical protein
VAIAPPRGLHVRRIDDDNAVRQNEAQLTQLLERIGIAPVEIGDENVGRNPLESGHFEVGNDRGRRLAGTFESRTEHLNILGRDGRQTAYASHDNTLSGRGASSREEAFRHRTIGTERRPS